LAHMSHLLIVLQHPRRLLPKDVGGVYCGAARQDNGDAAGTGAEARVLRAGAPPDAIRDGATAESDGLTT
jgi:hypothetical protein